MNTFSRWIVGLFTSPAGVVVLAALDSTVFFSLPFGIDAVVVILAARTGKLAWMVPLLATTGSVAGAALTFWMGAKLGEAGLSRFVPEKRLKRVQRRVRSTGAIALAVLDLLPPPFPFTPFVLAAGALEVDATTFFVTLSVCRLARFGGETLLAVHYGPHILAWLDSDRFHNVIATFMLLGIAASVVTIVRLMIKTSARRSARRARA